MDIDIGEQEITKQLYLRYADCREITWKNIQLLARRALLRGYHKQVVFMGLDTVIRKNFRRDLYKGDDALDEKRFILDAEFRAIMKRGNAEDILWC